MMEQTTPKLGSSLSVPSVKELVKEHLSTVPQRYVRRDQHPPEINDVSSLPQLPVVNLENLSSNNLMESELDKMHQACKEWGFFQEQREALEHYSRDLKILAEKLLSLMAQALHMDTADIKLLFDEGRQSMRMNCYPRCPQPDLVIGLNSHSDATGLTILLQVDETEGLQIKKDGMWVPVKPLPDAFVVNIGDTLEIVTNGVYPSVEHRAIVNSVKERFSIATFYGPNLDKYIVPAPSLITPDNPAKFRRIGVADYYKGYFSRELREKSYVDEMRIQDKGNGRHA